MSYLHHTLVVSSSSGAAKDQPSSMGRYKKMESKLQNDLPVWKKEEGGTRYIYYKESTKRWVIDTDFNDNAFILQGPSDDAYLKLKAIPRFGWKYWDGTKRASDDTLTISEGSDLDTLNKGMASGKRIIIY